MRGPTQLATFVTAALLLAIAAAAAPGPTRPMVAILSPEPMGDPDSALPGFFEGLHHQVIE